MSLRLENGVRAFRGMTARMPHAAKLAVRDALHALGQKDDQRGAVLDDRIALQPRFFGVDGEVEEKQCIIQGLYEFVHTTEYAV